MSKVIIRILIIGLIIAGGWHLWSSSKENTAVEKEFVEIEETENPAKKELEEDLTFEIKKNKEKIMEVKEASKKDIVNKGNETIVSEGNETIVEEIMVIENDKISTNISKFSEGEDSASMTVYLYEYGVDLSSNTIESGNVKFRVINNGRLSHNLTIKDGNAEIFFGRVAPGKTGYFQTNLNAGSFDIMSIGRVDSEKNMTKSLTVE